MKKEIVLKKVVQKAVKNGWKKEYTIKELVDEVTLTGDADALVLCMIFSHSFAKAFFGNVTGLHTIKIEGKTYVSKKPYWKVKLQAMVLAKDRLAYLEGFL